MGLGRKILRIRQNEVVSNARQTMTSDATSSDATAFQHAGINRQPQRQCGQDLSAKVDDDADTEDDGNRDHQCLQIGPASFGVVVIELGHRPPPRLPPLLAGVARVADASAADGFVSHTAMTHDIQRKRKYRKRKTAKLAEGQKCSTLRPIK
jgi:hypothetical protein